MLIKSHAATNKGAVAPSALAIIPTASPLLSLGSKKLDGKDKALPIAIIVAPLFKEMKVCAVLSCGLTEM